MKKSGNFVDKHRLRLTTDFVAGDGNAVAFRCVSHFVLLYAKIKLTVTCQHAFLYLQVGFAILNDISCGEWEGPMIKCHLSRLMGERKLKVADVARDTGLHRNTITLLYRETASRIELDAVDKLCELFNCKVGDLFERVPDANDS